MKKALILLSVLLLVFCSIFALSSCGILLKKAGLYDGYEYHVNSEYEITLTSYKGEDTKLEIPSWIDGYKVVGIAFDKNDESLKNIESIKIPKTIVSISADTFLPCTNLKEITVALDNPEYKYFHGSLYSKDGKNLICYPQAKEDEELELQKKVNVISDNALRGARNLKSVKFAGVEYVGDFSFSGCTELKDINFGTKLKEIGDGAFENCSALTAINIPDAVESIGASAFKGCTGINTISLGSGVGYVGSYAFETLDGIVGVTEHNGAYYLGNQNDPCVLFVKVADNTLEEYSIDIGTNVIYGSAFEGCVNLKNIEIPNRLSCIGNRAFYNCKSLLRVEIPEAVNTIEEYVFYGCSSMTEVVIPSSVSEIGNSAFACCTSLPSITLSNRTKFLGHLVFSECTSLKNIDIPACLTYIGNSAFSGCESLENLYIPSAVEFVGDSVFERCLSLMYTEYEGAYYLGNAENPYLILTRATDVDIMSVTISENTKFIYDSAFYGCTKLTAITIPTSVVQIGASAFEHCRALTEITIPSGVGYIGETAFYSCVSLVSVSFTDAYNWITDENIVDAQALSNPSYAAEIMRSQGKTMTKLDPEA